MPTIIATTHGDNEDPPKNATSSAPVANPAPIIVLMINKTMAGIFKFNLYLTL